MKRVKVSLEFPEKYFYEKVLIEWKNKINDKNQAYTIAKAYDNLHRFPIDVSGYKELRQIRGIGEHIATRLDAAWQKICDDHFHTKNPTLEQVKSLKKNEAFSFLETAFVAKGRHNVPYLQKNKTTDEEQCSFVSQTITSNCLNKNINYLYNQNSDFENDEICDFNTSLSQPLPTPKKQILSRSMSQNNLSSNNKKDDAKTFSKTSNLTLLKQNSLTNLQTSNSIISSTQISTKNNSNLEIENEGVTMLSYNYANFLSCKLVLIVDDREKCDRNRKIGIKHYLEKLGVHFEARPLSVGDYLWVLKMENDVDELVLDYIVERKTWDDLRSSIRKTRFYEQKRRLKESGIRNIVIIAEGQQTSDRSLEQALVTASVDNGFMIHRTLSMQGTAKFLQHLTNRLLERLKTEHFYGLSFVTFQNVSCKTKLLTVKDCWLRQLTVCPSMSVEKALLISNIFPTIRSLAKFYQLKAEEAKLNQTAFDATTILYKKIDEIPKALSAQLSMFFLNDCCK